jgi:hypothetical protein
MAAQPRREFGRQPANFATFGQDRLQQPDTRRERVAVSFDRLDQ